MHTDKIKQAIKDQDFLTFRKLLKETKSLDHAELVKVIKSYIYPADQETYLSALGTGH